MAMITYLNDHNIESFLQHDLSTMILATSTCARCITYIADVQHLMNSGAIGNAAVGVLLLDQPGASQFKRDNLWLAHAEALPFTVLYRNGQRVDGFSATRGHALLDHNRQVAQAKPELIPTG